MSKETQAFDIFDAFNERIIAYNVVYVRVTGSITAAVLLSQLVYWARTKRYEEFYKTDREIMEETGLGRKELIGAKKAISEFFTITRRGVPAKTHYLIKKDVLLAKIASCAKRCELDVPKGANKMCQKGTTIHTEITTEITTDTLQREAPPKKEEEVKIPDALNSLMEEFKTVNAHYARLYPNKTQREALGRLKTMYGEESLRAKIRFLGENNKTPFAPIVTTPVELEAKIGKIEAFWEQKKQQIAQKANPDDGHRFTHDGIELVFLKGEWRDAKNPWGIRLNTAYYPEIAQEKLLTREQWEEKKKSYAVQT